ncbi:MAG UNVERIFIED_CONTAM: hypothetical protein LVT10_07955 [Anaerolineae bacterium]
MKYQTKVNDLIFEIEITASGEVYVNGELRHIDFAPLDNALYSVLMETTSYEVVVESLEKTITTFSWVGGCSMLPCWTSAIWCYWDGVD